LLKAGGWKGLITLYTKVGPLEMKWEVNWGWGVNENIPHKEVVNMQRLLFYLT